MDANNNISSVELRIIIGTSLLYTLKKSHNDDEQLLKALTANDKLFVLLFLYNKNMNMQRDKIDKDVAVYGSEVIFIAL